MMKNAFITGAASGIGRATAETLYAQGWNLGLADINEQALKEMTLGWDEQRVHCYALDVTKPEQCTAVIGEFAVQHDKQLRLLFNSAGILQIDRFEDVSSQRHQQIFDINVMGTIHCCQAAFPYLRHTSGAQVINMSSASATYGIPRLASYSASKFAISGLTEALELEWEEYGIRVCDVMPPFVSTPMLNEQASGAPVLDKLGVHLNAEDVARTILQQIEQPKTHRAVSLQFALTYAASQLLPRAVTRAIIRFLNKG